MTYEADFGFKFASRAWRGNSIEFFNTIGGLPTFAARLSEEEVASKAVAHLVD